MADFSSLPMLLGRAVSQPLCRMVNKGLLESFKPAQYLYTSGSPGRYNPRDVHSLYCSEDMPTAAAEFDRWRKGASTMSVTYWVHPSVLVLDLENPSALVALDIAPMALFGPWRGLSVAGPTIPQKLGAAVAAQNRLAGIRFPSDAARERGFSGYNYVFFRKAVAAPMRIIVKDDAGNEVDCW